MEEMEGRSVVREGRALGVVVVVVKGEPVVASGRRADDAALVVDRIVAGALAMRRVDESSCLRVNMVDSKKRRRVKC
jgi:hypothetical protein